ncbi:WD40-repeat-containing domain protein [Podospora didyma]|uniref:WD40-repeat-containing domain protein n=1 Tax=Podospora didyma TaxID=330526 RepID=A0AAE0U8D4_9PEZI|nr:WD40-repeat-containing domain protein [Podospora didyma]
MRPGVLSPIAAAAATAAASSSSSSSSYSTSSPANPSSPSSSSSSPSITHSRPHRPSALSPSAPFTSAHPARHDNDDDDDDDDTSMTLADNEGVDWDEQGEDDDDDEAEEENHDDASLCYGHTHTHPHSHPHLHPHPLAHHHQPSPAQLAFFDHEGNYVSDDDMSDDDMSDGSGAPLVNFLEVANILTNHMDMDLSSDSGDYGHYHYDDDDDDESLSNGDDGDVTQELGDGSDTGAHNPLAVNVEMPSPSLFFSPPTHLDLASIISQAIAQPAFDTTAQTGQHAAGIEDEAFAAWFEGTHPVALTNPNPNMLGPSNYRLVDFLHHWARQARSLPGTARVIGRCPWPAKINEMATKEVKHVQYADLHGDLCDIQGIDWEALGVTRKEARERRLNTYKNYTNMELSDRWAPNLPDIDIPRKESYFRFRRMDMMSNVHLTHFQLRNVLGIASRTRAFYPGLNSVYQLNPLSGESQAVIKLGQGSGAKVTTLDAEHGVLVAGTFGGEYILRHLDSDEPEEEANACHDGVITNNASGITNHVQIHQPRGSSAPVAAFASNDWSFRVLDLTTEKWLSETTFDFPLNCTALSPDRRLRVMVGDNYNVLITAAESTLSSGKPEIIQQLTGHRDFGFACAWADDGWTLATGFQDRAIKIWDARWWAGRSGLGAPVCTVRTEMAGARSLRFSPIGSGKRVLVAAEEADFINIIDGQTFRSKQTVDIFGEIGGISFSNDGGSLSVLCSDRTRGGLIEFERCDIERQTTGWDLDEGQQSIRPNRRGQVGSYDWPQSHFTEEKRIKETPTRRRRRAAWVDNLKPF